MCGIWRIAISHGWLARHGRVRARSCSAWEKLLAGDWPVCTLAASYRQILELAEDFTREFSAEEPVAVFGGNAIETYSLDISSLGAQ